MEDNSNSHYLIATIYYNIGDQNKALEHIEKAIEQSDDHVIKHFYLRGLIHGIMGKIR